MLRARLLGEPRLELDGEPLPFPAGRRARALLGFLLLHPGPHPRAALAARFWPDVLDSSARASLRGALSEVRRALGPAAAQLEAGREHAGLVSVRTDAAEFDELVARGRDGEAVALAGGELLAGLDEDDWLLAERDAHRDALDAAHARLAAAAAQRGDHDAAVRHARARVALDGRSEAAARDLMTRLTEAGDRAAALGVHTRLADRLRTTLGVAPSAATRELVEGLRRGAPQPASGVAVAAPAAVAAPPRLPALPRTLDPRRARSPFVGRRRELDSLRAALDAARGGERRLVVVEGEPGIGKSRLAAELAFAAHADGLLVLHGRCPEEAAAPYEPLAEALRPLARSVAAGSLEGQLGLTPAAADAENAGAARLRLFDAAAAALAAAQVPALLVLDDLHWADRPSLRLLVHLLRAPDAPGLLVVATSRGSESVPDLQAALADLRRDRRVERIRLSRLTAEQCAELVAGWVGADGAPAVAAALQAESDGHPFFLEELLCHLLDSGTLTRDDGGWRLARAPRDAGVPESLREVVAGRLARLGEPADTVLATAAALGPEWDLTVVAAASGVHGDALLDALEAAGDAHLVRPAPGRPGRWAFTHALVRDALWEGRSPLRRARLDARVAEALEELEERDAHDGPQPAARRAALAHHGVRAATLVGRERAAGWAEAAGRGALAALAYEDAAEHFEQGLSVLEPESDGPLRTALLLGLGDARSRAGDPRSAEAFATAAQLARRRGDARLLAAAALGACGVGVAIVELDTDRAAALQEALDALGDDEPALRARLLSRLATTLYYAPGRTRSDALSAEAVAVARASGDAAALLAALDARHVALWRPDGLAERLAVADELIDRARAARRAEDELQGRQWRCVDLWEAGDIAGFEAEAAEHERLAAAVRLPAFLWYGPLWRAALAVLRGDHAAALPLIEEAEAAGTRAGDANASLFAALLGNAMRMQRRQFTDEDIAYVERKVATSPAAPAWLSAAAWYYVERDRREDARRAVDRLAAGDFAAMAWDANWLSSAFELAEACAGLRDAERAAGLYARLLPYADRQLAAGRAIHSYGSAHYALARLAATAGRRDEAERQFAAAEREEDRIGARPHRLRARARWAELIADDDPERARELAGAALAEATDLQMPDAVPPSAAALTA